MPHVVLNGDVRLRDVFDKMKPLIRRDEHVILRTLKKYIDGEEKSILTEALVIEKGKKVGFLALLVGDGIPDLCGMKCRRND